MKMKNNNKKSGFSAINVIIGVLVIMLTLSLLMEITMMGKKYGYMPETTSYVSRVLGEQGGLSSSPPSGYPEPSNYITNHEMYSDLDNMFDDAGFESWTLVINGTKFTSSKKMSIPEKGEIRITLTGKIKPEFSLPRTGDGIMTIETNRVTYSGFSPRNADVNLLK